MAKTTNSRLMFLDGQKAVDLWGDDLTGWTVLSGEGATTDAEYYKLIPTLYRAVQLRAQAVASMPFEIRQGKTTIYDSSKDWQNEVGFMPNPQILLQLVESALVMYGCAYLFRDRNQAITKKLRYHIPSTVTLNKDATPEKIIFDRPVHMGGMAGTVVKQFTDKDYVYFWLPDPTVEFGPAKHFPLAAAANACAVLMNMDIFADGFFARGAIKAMLLTVQGMPIEAERNRLLEWWKNVVAGVKNAFGAQIVNADKITPVVIGEGMKELENVTIGQEKREDISIAVGIPMSILFASAGTYATAQQDDLNFLTKIVIPDCEFIASVLNEQVFEPLGLHWDFLPETLDAMQEDEASRAQALNQLTTAGVPLVLAMDILGFELTDKQKAELMAAEDDKRARAEALAAQLAKTPVDETDNSEEAMADKSKLQGQEPPQNEKMLSDVDKWRRKALNAQRKGDPANVPFESAYIPPGMIVLVQDKLATATTADEVKAAFVQDTPLAQPIDWDLLRQAVNLAKSEEMIA